MLSMLLFPHIIFLKHSPIEMQSNIHFGLLSFCTGMESSDQWPFLSELQWFKRRRKRAVNVSVTLSH